MSEIIATRTKFSPAVTKQLRALDTLKKNPPYSESALKERRDQLSLALRQQLLKGIDKDPNKKVAFNTPFSKDQTVIDYLIGRFIDRVFKRGMDPISKVRSGEVVIDCPDGFTFLRERLEIPVLDMSIMFGEKGEYLSLYYDEPFW